MKPDVIAPGYQIISCNSQIHGKKDAYTVKSGSSMATPVVSGAVALLIEKYPRITNVEVKLRLRETCHTFTRIRRTGVGNVEYPRFSETLEA